MKEYEVIVNMALIFYITADNKKEVVDYVKDVAYDTYNIELKDNEIIEINKL